jgi:hypothetical protein
MWEKIKGANKNGQSGDTSNITCKKNMEVKQHLSIFSQFLYYLCLNIYCLESVISKRERKAMEQTRMGNLETQTRHRTKTNKNTTQESNEQHGPHQKHRWNYVLSKSKQFPLHTICNKETIFFLNSKYVYNKC